MRVYLVGTSGSGKTTLAKTLAARCGHPHLELDSLHHQANWTPLPAEDLRRSVSDFVTQENWVIDGNYSSVRDLIVDRCTAIVILDYSRSVVMRRVIGRTLARMLTRRTLWNGNREDWRFLFKRDPEENIILWAWSTFDRRRADFDELETQAPAGVSVIRLRRPSEAKKLTLRLQQLTP